MKIKLKERIKKITFPVFNYDIIVILSSDVKESRIKRDNEIGEVFNQDRNPAACHSYNQNGEAWIILPLKSRADLIAHEATHAVSRMFKYIEAQYEEEIFAYHLGYLVQQIAEHIHSKR